MSEKSISCPWKLPTTGEFWVIWELWDDASFLIVFRTRCVDFGGLSPLLLDVSLKTERFFSSFHLRVFALMWQQQWMKKATENSQVCSFLFLYTHGYYRGELTWSNVFDIFYTQVSLMNYPNPRMRISFFKLKLRLLKFKTPNPTTSPNFYEVWNILNLPGQFVSVFAWIVFYPSHNVQIFI